MWLTEDPWPPTVILLIAAAILGVVWSRNRRMLFLGLAVACVVLVGVVFLVERAVLTPAEEVEAQVYAVRDAVVRDDIEATVAFLSRTALKERALVAAGMTAGRVQPGARITDMTVNVTAGDTVAVSHFRANGVFTGDSLVVPGGDHRFATRWRVSWRKEGGEWKIFALERLNPINGETISLMSSD
jgi:hypothetical protein